MGVIDTVNIISKLLLLSPRNVFETRSTNNLIINELMKFAVQTNSRGNKEAVKRLVFLPSYVSEVGVHPGEIKGNPDTGTDINLNYLFC